MAIAMSTAMRQYTAIIEMETEDGRLYDAEFSTEACCRMEAAERLVAHIQARRRVRFVGTLEERNGKTSKGNQRE